MTPTQTKNVDSSISKKKLVGNLYITPERCTACKSCEIACMVEHSESKTLYGAMTQKNPPLSLIRVVSSPDGYPSPETCRHCEEPWCQAICQANAIINTSPEHPVLIDLTKCVGCKSCILACPFGAIQLDPYKAVPIKCDLCLDRTNNGIIPACVEACSPKAIEFLTAEQISAKKRTKTSNGIIGNYHKNIIPR
ncbi:MAG: 4Fe-4S dicluster domain-containing protein [Candidatus Ranarchaeia archaeon]